MKKRLFLVTIISTMLLSTVSVFATNLDTSNENVDIVFEEEGSVSVSLTQDENTPASVSVSFEIPHGFGYDSYVEIVNTETGVSYMLVAKDVNSYTSRGYIPYGTYKIVSKGIIGDMKGEYLFTLKSDAEFTVTEESKATSILLRMDKYDEVLAQINNYNEAIKEEPAVEEVVVPEFTLFGLEPTYETPLNGVYMDTSGSLYYKCEGNSQLGDMYITGNAEGDYDVVVTIIQEGVIGESVLSLSLDGGKTIIGTSTVEEDVSINGTGLTLHFSVPDDNDMFREGETFSVSIPATFKTVQSGASVKNVNWIVTGKPTVDYKVKITILSSGGLGQSKFTLSLDEGNSVVLTDTLPEDGVLQYGELTFYFKDGQYNKGNTFSCVIESKVKTLNYTPIIICVSLLIGFAIFGYTFLLMKKEKPIDYKLTVWSDRQSEDKYE